MISLIKGKIISKSLSEVVILTSGGVGYKINISPASFEKYEIGQEAEILTHLIVREDKQDLYGFNNEEERSLFILALSVSGIGPKSALHLLSLGSVLEIKNAIVHEDSAYLSKINGVGKKTAERLVLELKNKIGIIDFSASKDNKNYNSLKEVVDALTTMGYKEIQAREAIKNLDATKSSEELLREALKNIR